uniref:Uncharacterized protein n=1 Tax=Rhizophora mucronata TaxID=61149 RepID=A0A2P2P472_RHIMU
MDAQNLCFYLILGRDPLSASFISE